MLLFRSEEHVTKWYEERGMRPGATMSLATQWELARIWYSDRMDPGWRRRTPEEAAAVFAGLGLTDDFWQLT